MKRLATLALTALLTAFAGVAYGASATVSWTPPTTYTNGTVIPAGALASTRVEYGSCAGTNVFGTKIGEVVVNDPATSATIPGLADGSTFCFRAYAKTDTNVESAASNVASKVTPPLTPNPPVLSATITVAYEAIQQGREFRLGRMVGSIEIGTVCSDMAIVPNNVPGTFYPVDPADVTFNRKPKGIVVTQCAWI